MSAGMEVEYYQTALPPGRWRFLAFEKQETAADCRLSTDSVPLVVGLRRLRVAGSSAMYACS
jgi:hypothetical protein